MSYKYVASTQEGKLVKGVSDMVSREAVVQDLESKDLVVVSVELIKGEGKFGGLGLHSFGFISHLEKVVFTKHLTVMIKAGLSLLESLRILQEQATPGRFRAILKRVVKSIERGNNLSDSLAHYPKVFSAFFTNVIRAGESAGTLEQNLEHLAEQFTKDHELRSRVRNALLYPAFVIFAAISIGFYFALYIIPQISGLFRGLKGVEMPLATRLMMSFANFAKDHSMLLVFGSIGGLVFLIWFLRRKFMRPTTHWILLKMPLFGKLINDVNSALFCLVLGTQLRSGIPILQALDVTSRVLDNYYFQKAIKAAAEGVRRGNSLSESLASQSDIFSKLTIRMIEVGERSGRLDDVLGFLSDFYSLEVETTMKNLTTILEPVLLVVIGFLALSLAYAIIIPIYNFVGAIGDMGR